MPARAASHGQEEPMMSRIFLPIGRRWLVLALLVLGATIQAPARADTASSISVAKIWARATPPGAPTGAIYFTVTNTGTDADTLVSAATPAAKEAQFHESTVDNGISRMRPTGPLALAPGQSVVFAPGGKHVMLMGLAGPLKPGSTFPLTLTFAKAGKVDVTVDVEKSGPGTAKPAMSMSGMEMK
jgi:periplasmic copper chaperone A